MERIKRELTALQGVSIHVGILGDAGSDILMIAGVHEYEVKADKTEFVSFSIPATGWKTDSSVPGYTNYIDIAISGLTAADYVAVDVAPASSAVARAANFVATESSAGILRLRAASVPTATISAQYHIITAATAAKEG